MIGELWETYIKISIHAPLAGRDAGSTHALLSVRIFQSTRPLRGATASRSAVCSAPSPRHTRAPCGARLLLCSSGTCSLIASYTRPLRGATQTRPDPQGDGARVIHAPLAGRDVVATGRLQTRTCASYTRPLRGATKSVSRRVPSPLVASYTRPLRGATANMTEANETFDRVIHAPLAGRDLRAPSHIAGGASASYTRPLRGATAVPYSSLPMPMRVIHAPLAGRDDEHPRRGAGGDRHTRAPCGARRTTARLRRGRRHRHTRAPCGARRPRFPDTPRERYRHTRAPCGARRRHRRPRLARQRIVIHAPLAGRDAFSPAAAPSATASSYTRPLRGATPARRRCPSGRGTHRHTRAPCGARPIPEHLSQISSCIVIHAPLAGRDNVGSWGVEGIMYIVIHAPLAGRDDFAYIDTCRNQL